MRIGEKAMKKRAVIYIYKVRLSRIYVRLILSRRPYWRGLPHVLKASHLTLFWIVVQTFMKTLHMLESEMTTEKQKKNTASIL